MADALKTFFSPALVRRLGRDLANAYPAFPARAFVKQASAGLDALELLDRGRHIAAALHTHLPTSYPTAIRVLLRSLGDEHTSDELLGVGMAPFFYLPHTMFIAAHGLGHFDLSMDAQRELTKRFSAEASIRPYIAHDPARAFTYLRTWAADPNAHVRRLVSEGTRLRLPWAPPVAWLDARPDRVIALLELPKDDPSTMVRRSVANNLNDLGKVDPELLVRVAREWLVEASPERRALIEHALRSAVKRGQADALALLGFGTKAAVTIDGVRSDPPQVAIGGRVAMSFTLRSTSRVNQDLLVDVAVHFVKANGATSRKVFKLTRLVLPPRQQTKLRTSFSLAVHTTRIPYAGLHHVDVVVNGQALPAGAFDVLPPARSKRGGSAPMPRARDGR